jgi:hypothetical protein
MKRKLLLASCLILEAILLIGAVKPPLPESPKLAYLSMREAREPSETGRGEIEKERARLKRQQEVLRVGFVSALVINGLALIKLGRKRLSN